MCLRPFRLKGENMKNGSYLANPTGLIFFQHGQGWFLSKLNGDDQFKDILGPFCKKDLILKESFNYFQNMYLIDEEYDVYFIGEMGKEELLYESVG